MKRGVGQGFQSLLTAHGSCPKGGGAEVLGGGPFVPFLLLHTHTQKWILGITVPSRVPCEVVVITLRTGHNQLNVHMFKKMKLALSPVCN